METARALAVKGPAFTERLETGAAGSALTDAVEKLEGYFGRYRPLMPVIAGAPILMVAAAFTQSWVVGLLFIITAPLLPLFMAICRRRGGSRQQGPDRRAGASGRTVQ